MENQQAPSDEREADAGSRLRAVQGALSAAAESDDAAAMARLLLAGVWEDLSRRDSPLEAVRIGHVERAWQLADLTDDGVRYLWHLLLAWELEETGCRAGAMATLERLRGHELPAFENDDGAVAAFLALNLSELDTDLAGELYRYLTEGSRHFPTPRHLAALGDGQAALRVARALPNKDRRDTAFLEIASAQTRAGRFAAAAAIIDELSSARLRAAELISLAGAKALAGEREAARATLSTALVVAQSMKRRRDETLKGIAIVSVQIGDLGTARQLAPRIVHPGWRGEIEAAIAAAASQGELEAALQLASQIRSPEARAQGLTAIARLQAGVGDRAAACLTLGAALEAVTAISSCAQRAEALQEIGVLQSQAGEREAARRTFAALIEMAQAPRSLESRVRMLGITGLAQMRSGEMEAGEQTLDHAREAAREIEDAHLRSKALRSLAEAEAQGGQVAIALTTAEGIEDEHQRSRALAGIATAQVRAGQLAAAHQTARRIDEGRVHVQALLELALAERRTGDAEAARTTLARARDLAAQLEETWNQFPLLSEIALLHLEMQDPEAARDTFAARLMAAQAAVDRDRRDKALVSLVAAQASVGAFAAAMESARSIAGHGYRAIGFGDIVRARAAGGEIKTAWEILEQCLDPYPDDKVFAAVVAAQVQARKGEQEPLGELLEAVRQRVRVLEDGGDRQCLLGEVSAALARIQAFLPALEVAQEIEWDERRADVLGAVAALHAQSGDRETAQLTLAAALESAQRISNPWWRVDPLLDTARAFAEAGEQTTARAVLAIARENAEAIEDASGCEDELRRVVEAQSAARDFAAALDTAAGMHELPARAAALAFVAAAQAEAGERDGSRATMALAGETMRMITSPPEREETLELTALARARLGEFAPALEAAQAVGDERRRVDALVEIATLQAEAGDQTAARAAFALALQTARQITEASWQSDALASLATRQSRMGLVGDAVGIAAEIRSDRDDYWPDVAAALAERGDREAFKRLLVLSLRYPNAACKLCLLLPKLYPEQRAEIEAVFCAGRAG